MGQVLHSQLRCFFFFAFSLMLQKVAKKIGENRSVLVFVCLSLARDQSDILTALFSFSCLPTYLVGHDS